MTDAIESSSPVSQDSNPNSRQSLVDSLESQVKDLNLQLKFQEAKFKRSLADSQLAMLHVQNLQEELEHYYLLSKKQQKIIESLEKLQAKSTDLISTFVSQ